MMAPGPPFKEYFGPDISVVVPMITDSDSSTGLSDSSPFAKIPLAPPDPILDLVLAFSADKDDRKVNLGAGMYTDESGVVPVLGTVKEAERRLLETESTKGYSRIEGDPRFNTCIKRLQFGDLAEELSHRLVTVQTPGGTGALRLGAEFVRNFIDSNKVVMSDPTWANHHGIFQSAGVLIDKYAYYSPESFSVDFVSMQESLNELSSGTVVLLHVCCHNPTGADLSEEQWKKVAGICRERHLIAFLDFAYPGFVTSLEADRMPLRHLLAEEVPMLIASSCSKSFSLYRERVGALSVLAKDREEAERVLSQLKRCVRVNYSNPPAHGAQVVATILESEELTTRWVAELGEMRERIRSVRSQMVERLKEKGIEFEHLVRQHGMFSFTGLGKPEVERLRDEFSIYSVGSGRICVAAVNQGNIDHVVAGIASVAPERFRSSP